MATRSPSGLAPNSEQVSPAKLKFDMRNFRMAEIVADCKRLFGVPDDDASLTSFYSLGCEDRDFVLSKRGAIRGGKPSP